MVTLLSVTVISYRQKYVLFLARDVESIDIQIEISSGAEIHPLKACNFKRYDSSLGITDWLLCTNFWLICISWYKKTIAT